MKDLALIFFTALFLIFLSFSGALAIPNLINYQGTLTNGVGVPLTGPVSIVFHLYATESSVTPLWSESYQDLTVTNGAYNVLLGSDTPFTSDLFDNDELWLEVVVNGETMNSRLQMTSVPFAKTSQTALQALNLATGVVPCIPGDYINCYTGPDGTREVGGCLGGVRTCAPDGRFGPCVNEVTPQIEICDGFDNDCNGVIDNISSAPLNTNQQGVCAGSTQSCTGLGGWIDDYSGIPEYEVSESLIDGLDNDCNGETDIDADQFEMNETGATAYDLGTLSDTAGGGGGNQDGLTGGYCNGQRTYLNYSYTGLDDGNDTDTYYVQVIRNGYEPISYSFYTLTVSNGPLGYEDSITVQGKLAPDSDADWFKFTALDVAEGSTALDSFRVRINLQSDNQEYLMQVYAGSYSGIDKECTGIWPW